MSKYWLFRKSQKLREAPLIETDDNGAVDVDDRHAELARFLDHFLARLLVNRDVFLFVLHVVLGKKTLGYLAVNAAGSAVNYYVHF